MMMKRHSFLRLLTAVVMILLLAACGMESGGGGGVGGTGINDGIGGTGAARITTHGPITSIGSIYVNGIRFETADAAVTLDGERASPDRLAVGMVVTVSGTFDEPSATGKAETVDFDDSIEGPIAAGSVQEDPDGKRKTFTILGQVVTVDKNSTVFAGTSYATLAGNDVLEVSGFVDSSGGVLATRVEKKADFSGSAKVELKGAVKNLDKNTSTFKLGTTDITYTSATEFKDGLTEATLADGLFVEVKGIFDASIQKVLADKIEEEEKGFGGDADEVSIEGLITGFSPPASFVIQGQLVDASGAEFKPASLVLKDGLKVKVEGRIEGSILKAEKVEQRSGGLKFETRVSDVDPGTGRVTLAYPGIGGTVASVDVFVISQTLLKDEHAAGKTFKLEELQPGSFVEVKAQVGDSGKIIVNEMEREDGDHDFVLQGPLEDATQTSPGGKKGSVTVLGVTVATGSATEFKDITANNFFTTVPAGQLVKVKDNEPGDGVADRVELKD